MFILYTDQEAGEWKPWNTSLELGEIRAALTPNDYFLPNLWCHITGDNKCSRQENHICYRGALPFFAGADVLPVLHSILLPSAARWDATNRQWSYYICGEGFKNWWETYIANYKPDEELRERKFWWLDQGPGWSHHGVQGVRYQGRPDGTVFSTRQERERQWEEKLEFGVDWADDTPKARGVGKR